MRSFISRVQSNNTSKSKEPKPSVSFSSKIDINLSEQALGKIIKLLLGVLSVGTGVSLFGFLAFSQTVTPVDNEVSLPRETEQIIELTD